jgi:hypothetical protein
MVKPSASAGGFDEEDPTKGRSQSAAGDVVPGPFQRSVPSDGVSRPRSIHEIETHREHIRLNLENWEKQWADVLRYERAKVQDDANLATIRRALTRSFAALALSASLFIPALTDPVPLAEPVLWSIAARDILIIGGSISLTVTGASMWYAGHEWLARRRFKKSRTRPLLPPERLDAVQLLKSLEVESNPLYYRERDVAAELDFGWRSGSPEPPSPNKD